MRTSISEVSTRPVVAGRTGPPVSRDDDFISAVSIERLLERSRRPDPVRVRDIIAKSLSLKRLEPEETAVLLNVDDPALWDEIFAAAGGIKNRVYGPRVVTFAPLYCSSLCRNSCLYCSFRSENREVERRRLSAEEIARETRALTAEGHKRLIVVYGDHPSTGAEYMAETIRAIYETKTGNDEIRRVNVNAAPLTVEEYRLIKATGIGTYQVFQESYHRDTYRRVHPRGPKADYRWRLYALHRAQEAGIDDVAIGALFGLYDWRYEVMGLLLHAIELEMRFDGVGPHTISFPRLRPALNSPFDDHNPYAVSDEDFLRLIAVIRLSVPYTGMIITAREAPHIRRRGMLIGCTQTDASSRIRIGGYSEGVDVQRTDSQQFILGDERDLDDVIRELAGMGLVTSFCTAGYRCGRTGQTFMKLARSGAVRRFCMPNALLTFKEYLIDHASEETRREGERVIAERLRGIDEDVRPEVIGKLKETEDGRRDLRF